MPIATIKINLTALRHNASMLKLLTPKSQFMAVIKADAYGHGMIKVAQTLQNEVDCFAVARIDEAILLRESNINAPILVLAGIFNQQDLNLVAKYNLQTVIHSEAQLLMLQQTKLTQPISVWFKINTGMCRLGFDIDEAGAHFNQLVLNEKIIKPIPIMSHLSSSDELESSQTHQQIELFKYFINKIQNKSEYKNLIGNKSLAASGGILAWKEAHFDVVRAGISLYGVSPFKFKDNYSTGAALNLKPVMKLISQIINIKKINKNTKVGYNLSWKAPYDTHLAIVALGYGDGYPRQIPENTPAWLNGRLVTLVGRVSMDLIMLDLGNVITDKIGDEVVFWGNEALPIEFVANHLKVSQYELLTRLTQRIKRNYVD